MNWLNSPTYHAPPNPSQFMTANHALRLLNPTQYLCEWNTSQSRFYSHMKQVCEVIQMEYIKTTLQPADPGTKPQSAPVLFRAYESKTQSKTQRNRNVEAPIEINLMDKFKSKIRLLYYYWHLGQEHFLSPTNHQIPGNCGAVGQKLFSIAPPPSCHLQWTGRGERGHAPYHPRRRVCLLYDWSIWY